MKDPVQTNDQSTDDTARVRESPQHRDDTRVEDALDRKQAGPVLHPKDS